MKPRQKSAPETDEDFDVWLWVTQLIRRRGIKSTWHFHWIESDRRDADLMWEAQRFSAFSHAVGRVINRGPDIHPDNFIVVGGARLK